MRDKVININVTEGAVDDFEPWESSEKKEETVENRKFCDKSLKIMEIIRCTWKDTTVM